MDPHSGRSQGMIETLAPPLPAAAQSSWERFEQLYRSSRDDVYAYVATLLRDRAAAEDVTALAFERAYSKRRTFDRQRGGERAGLCGTARKAARDEWRRRRRRATRGGEPEDVESASVEDAADASL